MPYVYTDVRNLDKKGKVDSFECVALIRHYTDAPPTAVWREGEKALGNKNLTPGTAIATFVNGRYPSHSHGNHAAFYVGQVSDGIYVIDQWTNMTTKPQISKRFIRSKGKNKQGAYIEPSDNADAFSVTK